MTSDGTVIVLIAFGLALVFLLVVAALVKFITAPATQAKTATPGDPPVTTAKRPEPEPFWPPFAKAPTPRKPIAVPRPTWFEVDPYEAGGKTVTIKINLTAGEVAAANMELAAIGHKSSLAVFRNALQVAAKALR